MGELLGWVYDVADLLGGKITYDAVRTDPNISSRFVQELKDIFTAFRKDQFMAFSVDLKSLLDDMDPIDRRQRALEDQRARDASYRLEPVPDDAYSWPDDLSTSNNLVAEERKSDWWDFEKQVGPIPAWQLSKALFLTMDEEVKRIAARLQVQSEYVFNDYDRQQSEAELRYSISIPLVAVMIISTATWHWWALFGLVLPLMLVVQGYRAERSSIRIILSAVQYGTVKSPTAEALRDASTPRAGAAPRETARGREAAKSSADSRDKADQQPVTRVARKMQT